jgi:5-oxoprolinase (ATP-hydrolysing)
VGGEALRDVVAAFHDAHRRRYGFVRGAPIEVLEVRVRVQEPPSVPPAPAEDPWGLGDRVLPGPARIDTPTTSIWIPAGWTARRDCGLLRLDHVARVEVQAPRDPAAEAALWSARFMGVARRAGHVLQRVARSVNVRERLDFSCAVFDADGRLVANAPHVPVHLGAMGATVRSLIASGQTGPPGQQWVGNDPWAGGSHLPDLTVVRAVEVGGTRLFVANRAHHVDVGGTTPGSMPPRSASIDEEGFLLRHEPLLDADGQRRHDLALPGARQPDTVQADLDAQMAANETAARLLVELGPDLLPWLHALQDLAEEAVVPVLEALSSEPAVARDLLDGVPLQVSVHAHGGRLAVDFTGTGGPHPGNLNAPRAVVRAAVLYVLRVLAGRGLPLNDGLMRRVDLTVPPGCILDPPVGAAVAGGNVETSQRLVDLLLRATARLAPSTGTMANLTLGGPGWSLYETLGGGQGAGPHGRGASGRQVHMTNTRATDPEVLERRLPLRVHRMALRRGSGGQLDGGHRGGDGLVRELELLAGGQASLLCTRLTHHEPTHGEGRAALAHVQVGEAWRPWDGTPVELAPGDRVRVETPGGSAYRP